MESKVCSKCGETKAADDFYAGRGSVCRACNAARCKAWRESNLKESDSVSAAQAAANVALKAAQTAAWYASNSDRLRAVSADWRAANPERHKANARDWYRDNIDRARVTRSAWRRSNPERISHAEHKRRALKLGATIGDPAETSEWISVLRADPCSYCGDIPQGAATIDHIVALHGGGRHDWENLTAACRSCNSRKGTKSLLEFLSIS